MLQTSTNKCVRSLLVETNSLKFSSSISWTHRLNHTNAWIGNFVCFTEGSDPDSEFWFEKIEVLFESELSSGKRETLDVVCWPISYI